MTTTWELLDWIDEKKIDFDYLCKNTSDGAIELLRKNPEKINWGI